MRLVSVDPGETTGIAVWEGSKSVETFKLSFEEALAYFGSLLFSDEPPEVIVYEDFRLYSAHSHDGRMQGNRFETSQVIGMVKLVGKVLGVELASQGANILRLAAMHSGRKIPAKGHIDDELSAYLHGFYYLETKGLMEGVTVW